jgi:hypothetical protein
MPKYMMDTLGLSKRLRSLGTPEAEADAHAEGLRDFILHRDTLSYYKRLCDAGVPEKQAEAFVDAAREFIMPHLLANDL